MSYFSTGTQISTVSKKDKSQLLIVLSMWFLKYTVSAELITAYLLLQADS